MDSIQISTIDHIRDLKVSMAFANNMSSVVDKEQIFGMTEKEMEYRVELFNKLIEELKPLNLFVEGVCRNQSNSVRVDMSVDCLQRVKAFSLAFQIKRRELLWRLIRCGTLNERRLSSKVTNIVGQLLGSGRTPMIIQLDRSNNIGLL
uniref:Uncharacterized protein n=1 Tax=Cucumis melo TaxID=3656 RepID=A0A9I9ELG4_CUCME